MRVVEGRQPVIILPIQHEYAEAILGGRKRYEYRKALSEQDPSLVLLYVRERQAIVGAFLAGKVLRDHPEGLWRQTGGEGTVRARFDQYFEGQSKGLAILIRRFERFEPPIDDREIVETQGVLPPNFNLVYATPRLLTLVRRRSVLYSEFERHAPDNLDSFSRLDLEEFLPTDRDRFVQSVTGEIGKWYDDIDETFALSIISSHTARLDPYGLLTLGKKIHVMVSQNRRIGFSVATTKRGGSVKFGPTVIHPEFQGQGLGVLARRKLEEMYRGAGHRKAYSTIPDTHTEALKYLLKVGYRVEAHLREHYSHEHGEFVLAKRLRRSDSQPTEPAPTDFAIDRLTVTEVAPSKAALTEFVTSSMTLSYSGLDEGFVHQLSTMTPNVPQAEKPRTGVFVISDGRVMGCCVIIQKRGGAVKLAPLSTVENDAIASVAVESAERVAQQRFGPRKLYTLAAIRSPALESALEERGFEVEGLLQEPYKPGVDMKVYGKIVRPR